MIYHKIAAFREEGMESLFSSPKAKRRVCCPLPSAGKSWTSKADHPSLNPEEIANICGTLFEDRPDARR